MSQIKNNEITHTGNSGTSNIVLGSAGQVTMAGDFTPSKLKLGSDAAGDTMYSNGTQYVRLAKGTAAQVLAMNSGATAPEWVTGGVAATHQSVAKAWVNFNGTGTVAINQDYGVSSITDHGTGDYTINFDSSFADNDYCFVGMAENGEGTSNHDSHTIISGYYGGQAVGSFRLATLRTRFDQEPPLFQDCAAICVAFFL